MAVFKINKTKNYTVMSNTHLRENEMSLKAKGLLSVMLSLPQDWDYSINGLCAICKENETAITSTLNELKRFGYVVVNKIYPNKDNGGRIDYEYNIFEIPQKRKQDQQKQGIENLPLEIQGIENQGQLSTYRQSTKKQSKKEFIIPTYEEVQAYAEQTGKGYLVDEFYEYWTNLNWIDKQGKPVKSWEVRFATWVRNNDTFYGNVSPRASKPVVDGSKYHIE